MNRRNFLRHFSTYLAATAATCGACRVAFGTMFPGQTDDQHNAGNSMFPDNNAAGPASTPERQESDVSNLNRESDGSYRLEGCSLTGNFGGGGSGGFRFLHSSGDRTIDQLIFQEANILAHITGMRPSLAFLDDSNAPNAFAIKRDLITGQSPHGAVVLGVGMIRKMMGHGHVSAVGAVLVHEWAHIAQFRYRVQSRTSTVAPTELMADFVAGWYHGFRCTQSQGCTTPQFAESGLASVGDYKTKSRQHHGTPEQRSQAYRAGFQYIQGGGGGGMYGFQQYQNVISGLQYYGGGGYGSGGAGQRRAEFGQVFQHATAKYVHGGSIPRRQPQIACCDVDGRKYCAGQFVIPDPRGGNACGCRDHFGNPVPGYGIMCR